MTKVITLPLDEKEIETVRKRVFIDIKTYIDRAIKVELKKVLSVKKKLYDERHFNFI